MPTPTYDLLYSTTLTTSSSSLSFSSIPQSYKDLIIHVCHFSASAPSRAICRVNGDSGSNYNVTWIDGLNSGSVQSGESNTSTFFTFSYSDHSTANSTRPFASTLRIFDYSSTNKQKPALLTGGNPYGRSVAYSERWRNTSAITSLTIIAQEGGDFLAGSTFNVYGVIG